MGVSLNVNVPNVPVENIQGIRVCKMTPGRWVEEFEHRKSPHGQDYYWLTGKFINYEPENEETDEWALAHNYVTIVPIHNDLTHYKSINKLKHLEY
jgi:5'-nucleotidase